MGSTILVTQPSPDLIAAELPPTEIEQTKYFNVVYAAGAAEDGSSNLSKKKALTVDIQEYSKCAQIRNQRCPLFADKPINIAEAGQRLPETGVPRGIEQGAVQMESLQHFSSTLSGPATHGTAFRAQENPDEADEAELDPEDGVCKEKNADAGCSRAPDALIADENANAECLIGLDGTPDDDAMGKLAAVRAKLQLQEDLAKRMRAATVRAHASANDPDAALPSAAYAAAL